MCLGQVGVKEDVIVEEEDAYPYWSYGTKGAPFLRTIERTCKSYNKPPRKRDMDYQ